MNTIKQILAFTICFYIFLFKPKGSQLANQAIVGLNFGEINTKCCIRINGPICKDLHIYSFKGNCNDSELNVNVKVKW